MTLNAFCLRYLLGVHPDSNLTDWKSRFAESTGAHTTHAHDFRWFNFTMILPVPSDIVSSFELIFQILQV